MSQDLRSLLADFFAGEECVLEWGVAPAEPPPHADLLRAWVGEGKHAGMGYMATALEERCDPRIRYPWARSIVMFSLAYPDAWPTQDEGLPYQVAAYARGKDYHAVARGVLTRCEGRIREAWRNTLQFAGFVDTAPVFERDLAAEAGLGWRGKNCCTLSRTQGSGFCLAGFFLDQYLETAAPLQEFCGGCTRCIDSCPTEAFSAPGRLDAAKCISYWTIEHKGAVPPELSHRFGDWIFGCDICQSVCPWNHKHRAPRQKDDAYSLSGPEWARLLRKGGGFQSRFKQSPLTRAGRKSLLRNLAIAARNRGDVEMVDPLREALSDETDESLRLELESTLRTLDSGSLP